MCSCAPFTDELSTATTVASGCGLVALLIIAVNILGFFDFLQCVSDFKEVVDVEGTLQARDPTLREGG